MTGTRAKDAALILLLKSDPTEGLRQAIDLYGGAVKTVCKSILREGKPEDVEECVSDCFVKLWQGIESFDQEKGVSLKSYLYGIARHTALDHRRRVMRVNEILTEDENRLEVTIDLEQEVARRMNSRILQETVDNLPEPDRSIFIYRYYFFEKIKDIADKLGLSDKSVENRLHRGKEKLKDELIKRGVTA